jgi:hypothetical protein
MNGHKIKISPFRFAVTQPPGQEPPVVEGEVDSLDVAIREGGHYHRVYMQDGPCRLTVTDFTGEVMLMAYGGRKA